MSTLLEGEAYRVQSEATRGITSMPTDTVDKADH